VPFTLGASHSTLKVRTILDSIMGMLWGSRARPRVLATLAIVLLAACRAPAAGDQGAISVVASFYPLFEVADRVGGSRAAVTNLTPAGVEPHDLELTTREVDALLDADVVLYLGGGFQPAIEDVLADREGVTVDLLEAGPMTSGHDPHIWLDPHVMLAIVDRVKSAMAGADPPGAPTYRANAEAYRTELEGLAEEFDTRLADCDRDIIVTSHDAFGHLARRYGLRQEAITGVSPESEPDPRRLDEVASLVEAEGVTTIFTETLVSPAVAETLAGEAGVRTAVLDPIEGLTAEQEAAGEDYPSVMRRNLAELREALGCD
jgi:zinc transport system substrate-binding protein